jgi:hypothetical protein
LLCTLLELVEGAGQPLGFSGQTRGRELSSVEDVGEGLVPASLADAAIGIPAILMTVVLVMAHSDLVAIMLIIVVVALVAATPFERVLLLDRAGDEPLQFATVEPDAATLLANVDRHAVTLTFVEH